MTDRQRPGPALPGLAGRLNHLFATVPRGPGEGGQPHSNESAATALNEAGIVVTRNYIAMLRSGRRDNPSSQLIGGLARLFGVPVDYFFDPDVAGRIDDELASLVALRDARLAGVMMRSRGLSDEGLRQVEGILDHIRHVEGLGDDDDDG